MTTFAYRDGIIASDTAVTLGHNYVGKTIKIVRRGDHFAGAAGTASIAQSFIRWFEQGMTGKMPDMVISNGDEPYTAYGYIFCPDSKIICFDPSGSHWHFAEYIAEGSGAELALGAMAHGASAIEAVEAAVKHDVNSRAPITALWRDDVVIPSKVLARLMKYEKAFS